MVSFSILYSIMLVWFVVYKVYRLQSCSKSLCNCTLIMRYTLTFLILLSLVSCNYSRNDAIASVETDSIHVDTIKAINVNKIAVPASEVTRYSERTNLVDFAETFLGTPYKYASADP